MFDASLEQMNEHERGLDIFCPDCTVGCEPPEEQKLLELVGSLRDDRLAYEKCPKCHGPTMTRQAKEEFGICLECQQQLQWHPQQYQDILVRSKDGWIKGKVCNNAHNSKDFFKVFFEFRPETELSRRAEGKYWKLADSVGEFSKALSEKNLNAIKKCGVSMQLSGVKMCRNCGKSGNMVAIGEVWRCRDCNTVGIGDNMTKCETTCGTCKRVLGENEMVAAGDCFDCYRHKHPLKPNKNGDVFIPKPPEPEVKPRCGCGSNMTGETHSDYCPLSPDHPSYLKRKEEEAAFALKHDLPKDLDFEITKCPGILSNWASSPPPSDKFREGFKEILKDIETTPVELLKEVSFVSPTTVQTEFKCNLCYKSLKASGGMVEGYGDLKDPTIHTCAECISALGHGIPKDMIAAQASQKGKSLRNEGREIMNISPDGRVKVAEGAIMIPDPTSGQVWRFRDGQWKKIGQIETLNIEANFELAEVAKIGQLTDFSALRHNSTLQIGIRGGEHLVETGYDMLESKNRQ